MNRNTTILLLSALLSLNFFPTDTFGFLFSEEIKKNVKKDTLPSLVLYGTDFLLDDLSSFETHVIEKYQKDLAEEGKQEKASHVGLYLKSHNLSNSRIINIIDSLLLSETKPYALINQLNLFVSDRPAIIENHKKHDEKEIYPAHAYYNSWSTTKPIPWNRQEISKSDTILTLDLEKSGITDSEKFVVPFDGLMTSNFGWRHGRNHNGVDIDLEVMDSVVSAFDGMVRMAQYYGAFGRVVVVRHYNGLETIYAHLHRFNVKPGDTVKAGELIGYGGSSGRSTGSHLHFEIRFKGYPLNPQNFISFSEKRLLCSKLILKKTKSGYASFPEDAEFHIVRRGDYLHKIAQEYGTTISKICSLNNIPRNKSLSVGDKIRII
jgi:murein DD-endopeptidase MepM/ murein hydrolase activator NlpD